jgi:CRP-like cAMP-binding protein
MSMSLQPADYFAHLSNLLLLVSYSVRDILWLRWFAVAAAFIVMPYYLYQSQILWPPIVWGSVFAVINLYQISRIYAERRPVVLSAEEQKLYDLAFTSLRPREFMSLTLVGEWRTAEPGQCVVKQGAHVTSLCIAIAGNVQVCQGDRAIGIIPPGHILGTTFALIGQPSPIDVKFVEDGRYMLWPLDNLLKFMEQRPDLRVALQGLASRDLAQKIEGMLERELQVSPV